MCQYAQVIVDVPTRQTNQPYTYKIPAAYQGEIKPGMRVIVPFGKGGRKIQGFVVGLIGPEELIYEEHLLKTLIQPLDFTPVLNQEALQLADWLAETTFAFKISCLQVMLPNVMRASYHKTIRLLDQDVPVEIKALFQKQNEIPYDDVTDAKLLRQLVKLRQANKVEIVYHVKDRAQKKMVTAIQKQVTNEEIVSLKTQIPKNAVKQAQLLDFLASVSQTTILQSEAQVQSGLTAADFKTGAKKGWLKQIKVEKYRDPYADTEFKTTIPKSLTPSQTTAVQSVTQAMLQQQAETYLLQGVTGSGKTEVYLQIIAEALAQKKTALMLVPEISLTPQMVQRVRSRFGQQVAVLHSGLSDGEKYDEWRRVEEKQAQVVVGARSAVFAPLENLGVIIMDEEHESSYKQDEMPRYHARDVAIWRSQYHGCPVVLGSATPALETRARAQKDVYHWLQMPDRINGQAMPPVKLVDMREALKEAPAPDISQELLTAIKQRLAKKEQVVLMLNRRGYSSFMLCRECGFVLKCPNCDISLTLHMDTHSMKCHYCGHEEAIPQTCPQCQSRKIKYYGTGTQKVQEELAKLLLTARVLRMDVDTTRRKGAHEKILQQFGNHEADILLGTQMIAKGLDFPDVTLVGVLNADTALGLANYRASETTFQLLTQVSGRAGRADKKGEVIVQTYNPEHYAIQWAQAHDYESFYRKEMQVRHLLGYPPYYFTIKITVSGNDQLSASKKIHEIYRELQTVLSKDALMLGPTPQQIMRINNRYYFQLVIKYKFEKNLEQYLKNLLVKSQTDEKAGIKLVIDRNPLNFI
ncbi:primosomal protein N' [Ligilactobacillus ceti]|uniref:Replication restart protein PriA n=1 Tax=Ligilactobacillus ceti DSM 22408 TaxID=1122146 RepID=A0A0R2KM99_9LACO|nr:primosomal protein N' [Ligilactobacillus ceti]KRN88581.1 primosomal protein n [Ligilactobacillus ceti DSM 22408]